MVAVLHVNPDHILQLAGTHLKIPLGFSAVRPSMQHSASVQVFFKVL